MRTLKVWGSREELFKNDNVLVTLLRLNAGTYSSFHNHKSKTDKFTLIRGEVKINTELGETILKEGQSLVIDPPLLHQFIVEKDSIMIEISYSTLDLEDINRIYQGGKIIDGERYSLNDLNRIAKEQQEA